MPYETYWDCVEPGVSAPRQGKVFATNKSEAERARTVMTGMDWLAANHASIDCSRKEVVINPLTVTSLNLKSMVDTGEADVSLTLKPLVRDDLDVFPEELPRLPPYREIDFAIELEPDIVPISRAPYRMALIELK
ncbi:gag protease polyprotein [Cucumis melo var. makuwa]|uniref:Gag protease polyprotein n=1 Tax=Cucumis melo var. makuwa TaxID=1194695 RepID=A0A5A7UPA6_CUCMM|nr:gag protease polyprotein [Cucumis melo var. makuwa]